MLCRDEKRATEAKISLAKVLIVYPNLFDFLFCCLLLLLYLIPFLCLFPNLIHERAYKALKLFIEASN